LGKQLVFDEDWLLKNSTKNKIGDCYTLTGGKSPQIVASVDL